MPVVDARVTELTAIPRRTKAEKKELSSLKGLAKKLSKSATKLSQDFVELAAAGTTFHKLGAAGDPFADALDESLARAAIALNEREDFVADHRALVTDSAAVAKIGKATTKARDTRAAADGQADPEDRARLLKKAEQRLTAALKLAEKYARKTSKPLPPVRLRSGDVVGLGGARVAVPRGTGSSLDGASVLIPPGALASNVTVSLYAADDFVGGRDVPAGNAMAVTPSDAPLNADATVFLPFALPDGTSIADVTIFRDDGADATPLTDRTLNADGTISGTTSTLGTFQAGVQAPPVGAPDGHYLVHGFAVVTGTGTTSTAAPVFNPVVNAGLLVQDFQFRRDRTGTASSGSISFVNRSFTPTSPHHAETSGFTPSSYDFVWSPDAANRFSYGFPVPPSGDTVAVTGVASTDGNVIVLTGHGGTYDFVAVGLRTGAITTAADLEGRWSGAEIGIELLDADIQPFRTRWSGASRTFDVSSAGAVTFDGTGSLFTTDVRYATDAADPVHTTSAAQTAGGAGFTLHVAPDGRLTDGTGTIPDPDVTRFGFLAKGQGALVLGTFDGASLRTGLLVAARQPATVPDATFQGTWNLVRFEEGTTVGTPSTRSSTHELLGRRGTLAVDGSLAATEDLDAAPRAVYTLTGAPPISGMTWTMSLATPAESATSRQFTLVLDGAGSDRSGGAPVWWSVAGDGSLVFGAVTANDAKTSVGIVVGVK